MYSPLWIAMTGLDAQQTRMAVIANNLANVNTAAFKRGNAVFEDLLYQNVSQVGAQTTQTTQSSSGILLGTGVQTVATEKLFTQGNINETNNPLDFAIKGRGFFQVLLPDGTLGYTRDGSFQIDSQGQLVTANGNPVQPAVTIPSNALSVTVGSDGIISAALPGQSAPTQVGTLQLADFVNPVGLQPDGDNILLESAASGSPQTGTAGLNGLGSIVQRAVEGSNVNVVEELVNMIETQRAYEMNSKAISTTDQMLQYATNNI